MGLFKNMLGPSYFLFLFFFGEVGGGQQNLYEYGNMNMIHPVFHVLKTKTSMHREALV